NRREDPGGGLQRVEDDRWRRSARALGLDLVDDEGRKVLWKRGTRAHVMIGRVAERDVRVRCGLRRPTDGVIVTRVALSRSLLLGLKAHAYRGPPRGGPSLIGMALAGAGPLRFDVTAIDMPRVRGLLGSPTGRELVESLKSIGAYGWVELADRTLLAQSEFR